jgi:hypothetical protein
MYGSHSAGNAASMLFPTAPYEESKDWAQQQGSWSSPHPHGQGQGQGQPGQPSAMMSMMMENYNNANNGSTPPPPPPPPQVSSASGFPNKAGGGLQAIFESEPVADPSQTQSQAQSQQMPAQREGLWTKNRKNALLGAASVLSARSPTAGVAAAAGSGVNSSVRMGQQATSESEPTQPIDQQQTTQLQQPSQQSAASTQRDSLWTRNRKSALLTAATSLSALSPNAATSGATASANSTSGPLSLQHLSVSNTNSAEKEKREMSTSSLSAANLPSNAAAMHTVTAAHNSTNPPSAAAQPGSTAAPIKKPSSTLTKQRSTTLNSNLPSSPASTNLSQILSPKPAAPFNRISSPNLDISSAIRTTKDKNGTMVTSIDFGLNSDLRRISKALSTGGAAPHSPQPPSANTTGNSMRRK